jgi:DNA-binding PadR family transcriptional regulator
MEIAKELLKGSLKSIVLKLLSEKDRMYGYEITQTVETLSKGKIKLTYGALYPILHKLENDGHVETEKEIVNNRTRVYYRLTKSGFSTAEEKISELEEFIATIRILISPNPALEYAGAK